MFAPVKLSGRIVGRARIEPSDLKIQSRDQIVMANIYRGPVTCWEKCSVQLHGFTTFNLAPKAQDGTVCLRCILRTLGPFVMPQSINGKAGI